MNELRRAKWGSRLIWLATAILILVGLALLIWRSFGGRSIPQYLVHSPTAEATAQASRVLAANGKCSIIRSDPLHILPVPYRRCNLGAEVSYMVSWTSNRETGLLFAPGMSKPIDPDTCVRRIHGPWWADVPEGSASSPCPSSFEFLPAP